MSKCNQWEGPTVLMQVIWTNESRSLTTMRSRQRLTLTRSLIWFWTVARFSSWTTSAHHDISVRRNTHILIHHNCWRHSKQLPAGKRWRLGILEKSDGLGVRIVGRKSNHATITSDVVWAKFRRHKIPKPRFCGLKITAPETWNCAISRISF